MKGAGLWRAGHQSATRATRKADEHLVILRLEEPGRTKPPIVRRLRHPGARQAGHRQGAIDIADRVVPKPGAQRERGRDCLVARQCNPPRAEALQRDRRDRVAEQETRGFELCPRKGQDLPEALRGVIGGDGERGRVHAQHAVHIADRVV